MKKYKVFLSLFLSLLIMGCKFPDNVPQIDELQNYKLDVLKFGKTTVKNFEALTKNKVNIRLNCMTIFDSSISNNKFFNKARVAFVNNKMDWIEFKFAENVSASELLRLYGKPISINKKYSKEFDYYEYGDFSLSLPKNQDFFTALNLFNLPLKSLKNKHDVMKKEEFKIDFLTLEVGKTLESDFNLAYPTLQPSSLDSKITEYELKDKLTSNPLIKKILLKFDSGLLNWVTIIPLTPLIYESLNELKDQKYTVEKKQKYDFYIFNDVILTLSKDKKIINIGVLDGKVSPFLSFKIVKPVKF